MNEDEKSNPDLSEAYRRTLEDLIISTGITLDEGERIIEQIMENYAPPCDE
jgi:hypothetical protein